MDNNQTQEYYAFNMLFSQADTIVRRAPRDPDYDDEDRLNRHLALRRIKEGSTIFLLCGLSIEAALNYALHGAPFWNDRCENSSWAAKLAYIAVINAWSVEKHQGIYDRIVPIFRVRNRLAHLKSTDMRRLTRVEFSEVETQDQSIEYSKWYESLGLSDPEKVVEQLRGMLPAITSIDVKTLTRFASKF